MIKPTPFNWQFYKLNSSFKKPLTISTKQDNTALGIHPAFPCHGIPPLPLVICTEHCQETFVFSARQTGLGLIPVSCNYQHCGKGWPEVVTETAAAGRGRGKHYQRKAFSLCPYLWREPWAGCFGMALRATGHTLPLETGTKRKREAFRTETSIPKPHQTPHNGIPNGGRCHCRNTRGQPASVTTAGSRSEPCLSSWITPKDHFISPGYFEFTKKLQQLPSHPQLAVHKGRGIY